MTVAIVRRPRIVVARRASRSRREAAQLQAAPEAGRAPRKKATPAAAKPEKAPSRSQPAAAAPRGQRRRRRATRAAERRRAVPPVRGPGLEAQARRRRPAQGPRRDARRVHRASHGALHRQERDRSGHPRADGGGHAHERRRREDDAGDPRSACASALEKNELADADAVWAALRAEATRILGDRRRRDPRVGQADRRAHGRRQRRRQDDDDRQARDALNARRQEGHARRGRHVPRRGRPAARGLGQARRRRGREGQGGRRPRRRRLRRDDEGARRPAPTSSSSTPRAASTRRRP